MNKFLITTPIYYVNDVPHIGSAYTTLVADVLARAHRQFGNEVLFLTGTDEHGAKIAQKAASLGQEPQQYADSIAAEFQKTWQLLHISHDHFVRTTHENHVRLVQRCMTILHNKKLLYEAEYSGWYCVACEEYKDVEVDSTEGSAPPLCEIHQKPLEQIQESVYYFALSQFQEQIKALISTDQLIIKPEGRKNEVLAFLTDQPLRDIPVTRSKVSWGIPVPFAPEQTVYVWFDALLNYLTFSDGEELLDGTAQPHWWPADLQLLGKDILRFHAVIWPAMLLALDLPLPKELAVHGFFTINGAKMSKTTGNVIAPQELIDRYGIDATRYLLVSAFAFGADGDISIEKLDRIYTDQLANGLGNLLQRTVVLINKFGIKPQVQPPAITMIAEAYQANDIARALAMAWQLIDDANRYLATEQPWAMTNDALRETVLVKTYEELLKIAQAIRPVMPEVADQIKIQLESLTPQPLFPRLD